MGKFVNLFDSYRTDRPDDYAFHSFADMGLTSIEYGAILQSE